MHAFAILSFDLLRKLSANFHQRNTRLAVGSAGLLPMSGDIGCSCHSAVELPHPYIPRRSQIALLGAVICLFAMINPGCLSQTAPISYSAAIMQVATSPGGYTVDSAGNIYVISSDGSTLLKKTRVGGTYLQSVVSSGTASDLLAVDGSGDVFRLSGGTLYEEVNQITGSTYQATPYIEKVIYNFTDAIELMVVDNTAHVYVFDATQNELLKLTQSSSGWGQSFIATSLTGVVSIGVDINQNVYALELNGTNGTVEKFTYMGAGYAGTEFTSGLTILTPQIAVDASGDVFAVLGSGVEVTEFQGGTANRTTIPCPPAGCPIYGGIHRSFAAFVAGPDGNLYFDDASGSIYQEVAGPPNLGTVDVGSTATIDLAFARASIPTSTFSAAIVGPFTLEPTVVNSCQLATEDTTPIQTSPFCFIGISFTPPRLGLYQDDLEVTNTQYSPVAVMIQGTGAAPQIGFSPAPRSIIISSATPYNLQGPEGIAVDGKGNLYIADTASKQVLKETLAGGQYIQTVIANAQNGLKNPVGVAVDAAGNVYIADEMVGILKETLTGSGYAQSTAITAQSPGGVAVDSNGVLYFISGFINIVKAVPSGGQYTQTTILSSSSPNTISSAQGIAVDANGAVYITDATYQRAIKLSPASGGYTQSTVASGFGFPFGVAVDFAGNVYVGDEGGGFYKESLSNGVYTQTLMNGSIEGVYGVAVDGSENVYGATSLPANIYEIPAVQSTTLSFASTPVGTTSPDSPQTLTVQNVGLYPLTFTTPGTGANPFISAGFTIGNATGTGSTCPDLFTSPTGAELSPGGSCTYQISFTPTTAGAITGSLTFTDNSDNVAGATQTVTLIGTATTAGNKSTPTVVLTASSSTITTAQALTVTASVSGGSGSATPTGSVTLTGGGYTSTAKTLTGGSATIDVPAGSLAIGVDPLTVTYTPDSASSSAYNSASNSVSVTVTAPAKTTPTVLVSPSVSSITTSQTLIVMLSVSGGSGNPTPTGSVLLASGSYGSAAATLSSGNATISIPSGSLATGTDTITATYTPDAVSSSVYNSATGTSSAITVTAPAAPAVTLAPTNLTFAAQTVGTTSTVQSVTLTNSGNAALSLTSVSASGDFAESQNCGTSIAAGGSCTLSVTFTPTSSGTRTGTLSITDNATGSPQTVSLSGGGEYVTLSSSSSGLSIPSPGGTATGTIQIAPVDGFTGTVNLTCTVAYQGQGTASDPPTCSLSPSQAQVTGATPVSTTLTVSTTAANASASREDLSNGAGISFAALLCFGLIPRCRWRRSMLLIALCVAATAGFIGCGGSPSGSSSAPPSNPGTTAGSYVVTVTATSGTAAASTTVSLSLQ